MRADLLVASALLLTACSKDGKDGGDSKAGEAAKAAPAATPRDAVLAAWTAAKIAPAKLAPATVAFAKDCEAGTVEGLDVLLCGFATPAEAKAAEDPGLAWIGAATGAAQAHGAVLIVIADRKKADPSGRAINRLMKLAPN